MTASFADRMAGQGLIGLIRAVRRLPYERRVPFMGALMRRGVGPLTGYRRRVRSNLASIWPEMPQDNLHQLAGDVLDNFGRTFIENMSPEFHDRLRGLEVSGPGVDALQAARAEGRPILFVNAHFGNHDVPRHVLTHMGMTIGGLYRPFRNATFEAFYSESLGQLGGTAFEQGRRGTIGLIRFLRDGGHGILFYDVNYDLGEPLPFMGRMAMTATSAADIARKVDALVLPNFGIRQPDGLSFQAVIEAPIPHADPRDMTQEMNARLEARVNAHPEQWFWVHNRWKDKRGVIAALEKGAT